MMKTCVREMEKRRRRRRKRKRRELGEKGRGKEGSEKKKGERTRVEETPIMIDRSSGEGQISAIHAMRIGPAAFDNHNVKYAKVLKAKEAGQHCTHIPTPKRKDEVQDQFLSSPSSLFPLARLDSHSKPPSQKAW